MAPTLQQLNDFLSTLDPQNVLQGVSYNLDSNNKLGFNSNDPFNFYAATPYGEWSRYPAGPPIPNVYAAALAQALFIGLPSNNISISQNGDKYVFVDCLNLSTYDTRFWTANGDNGISVTLRFFVNNLPQDVTPVIRLLSGDPGMSINSWTDGGDSKSWRTVGH